jgi:hypothetical protein
MAASCPQQYLHSQREGRGKSKIHAYTSRLVREFRNLRRGTQHDWQEVGEAHDQLQITKKEPAQKQKLQAFTEANNMGLGQGRVRRFPLRPQKKAGAVAE